MNAETLLFMQLLCKALKTKSSVDTPVLTDEAWKEIFKLALMHNLAPTMYAAVKDIPTETEMQQLLKSQWKTQAQLQCVRQSIVYETLKDVLQAFKEKNINVAVLKGPSLAQYYPEAIARVSGDIDLYLLNIADADAAHKLMINVPNTICDSKEVDTASYTINELTHIELHFTAFVEEKGKFFELFSKSGVFEPNSMRKENILDIEMTVPDPTDMLIYLVCHMAQHFVGSGFGIRHIVDFWLFFKNNLDKIELKTVERILNSMHLLEFYRTCLVIAIKQFDFTEFDVDFNVERYNSRAEELLDDILSAGVFGYADNERTQSGAIVQNAFEGGNEKSASMLRKLFPKYKTMAKHFPYCKKYPILLPVAYVDRFIKYRKNSGQNISEMAKTASKVADISEQRINLLKKLDMLNDK